MLWQVQEIENTNDDRTDINRDLPRKRIQWEVHACDNHDNLIEKERTLPWEAKETQNQEAYLAARKILNYLRENWHLEGCANAPKPKPENECAG